MESKKMNYAFFKVGKHHYVNRHFEEDFNLSVLYVDWIELVENNKHYKFKCPHGGIRFHFQGEANIQILTSGLSEFKLIDKYPWKPIEDTDQRRDTINEYRLRCGKNVKIIITAPNELTNIMLDFLTNYRLGFEDIDWEESITRAWENGSYFFM
jgi:hypothetical protein